MSSNLWALLLGHPVFSRSRFFTFFIFSMLIAIHTPCFVNVLQLPGPLNRSFDAKILKFLYLGRVGHPQHGRLLLITSSNIILGKVSQIIQNHFSEVI